ncbi:nitroreductase [Pseudoduganella sp. FT55W]|uniref:Nitroreductase n=1 Tax=Duganella rivi TaxID=2666083 RepID=A0A7X4KAI4_9BURK|nr:nitroreductase family protein [Duganella rivi]MYM65303.1 nitroreductase [Duganella rivi]
MLDKLHIFGSAHRPTKARIWLRFLKNSHKIFADVLYDVSRYVKYSSSFHLSGAGNLKSRITAKYHEIEKGLSLPAPRKGFGVEKIDELTFLMNEYIARYGKDDFLRAPSSTLRAYVKFNESHQLFDYPRKDKIQAMLASLDEYADVNGGVIGLDASEIYGITEPVSDQFFLRRYSIRQFSDKPVAREDIDSAVAIALKSPAVCNRQDGFVHVVENKELIKKMTDMHGGARGFAEKIDKLLVITNKLTNFWESGERNQCWIDGGLFSMSLILGLHSKGIGSCCLNWSKRAKEDKAMRDLLNIPDSEVIIMLLAVGHLPEHLNVAYSNRKPVTQARRYL